MKGMVFTEFLEMVEDQFGYVTADKIVTSSNLESGGVYTSVGTYSHHEMVQLVTNLSKESEIKVPDLLKAFGIHLFGQFAKGYGHFFADGGDAFTFLAGIENYIHIEVKKLYPDAELPTFEIQKLADKQLEMVYKSERGFADFAEGLILGCVKYFEEDIRVDREDIKGPQEVRFILTHNE